MPTQQVRQGYLSTILLAATITAAGNVLALNWERIFGSKREASVQEFQPAPTTPAQPTPSPRASSARTFGQWANLDSDTVYQAESDGFVVVRTGGDNPASVVVDVGEAVDRLTMRTRAGRWDGVVCPVPRASYWRVRSVSGPRRSVTVWWLPVTNVEPTEEPVAG